WRNAFAYMRGRDDIDPGRGAIFGSGGTGGGNAILVAAAEPDARATISQVPVADGSDWLHRMRQEHEWVAFLASVDEDRRARASTHYAAYKQYANEVIPLMVDWLEQHVLGDDDVTVRASAARAQDIRYIGGSGEKR